MKNVFERIGDLEKITKTQCEDGNWNYDEYMYGLANGLICALMIMQCREIKFLKKPKKWLRDKKQNEGR